MNLHSHLSQEGINACVPSCSRHVFKTLWTIASQAPLTMEFSRQEYWNRLQFPSPGDLPNPGIKLASLVSSALVGGVFTTSATWEDQPLNKGTLQIQKSGISNLIETFSNGISSGS